MYAVRSMLAEWVTYPISAGRELTLEEAVAILNAATAAYPAAPMIKKMRDQVRAMQASLRR